MTDTIRPALTRDEWEEVLDECGWFRERLEDHGLRMACDLGGNLASAPRVHALAALALHGLVVDGKPVGFTREMADILADALDGAINDGWGYTKDRELAASAIANIRALLPPEVA